MAEIPKWDLRGDWFDTCKCSVPCPCTFAQPPTSGDCDGILAWHIRTGHYGDVPLDGLSVMALASFTGNIWEGETKASMAMFIDERADERQRDALQMIFGGRVGGGGLRHGPAPSRSPFTSRCAPATPTGARSA